MLKANGKFIDTLPLRNLLSLEESKADTVIIQVDRYHHAHDLYHFIFVMRGITESGKETQKVLIKRLDESENYINLIWNISGLFTSEAGKLFLDLTAYQYENPETDTSQNPPDYLLHYQLPAIEIRDIPKGTSQATDAESYTAFWTQVLETLTQHTSQIQALQNRITIQAMTQAAYDALENPDPQVLYIITAAQT
ncbi:MAG: hypothetical protein IJ642_10830 [Oscillospiraceae bacterium]|nr:hypothetical protein [Oscillospiraceae bacterium]